MWAGNDTIVHAATLAKVALNKNPGHALMRAEFNM